MTAPCLWHASGGTVAGKAFLSGACFSEESQCRCKFAFYTFGGARRCSILSLGRVATEGPVALAGQQGSLPSRLISEARLE